jgi:hypothetical protein
MTTCLCNISENEAAKKLGLTRNEVRELRMEHLYQDEDFARVGREIQYTDAGIEKLRQIIKKNAPAGVRSGDLGMLEEKPLPAAPNALQGKSSAEVGVYLADRKEETILDAVVTRVYPTNRQYMEALLGDLPIVIHVRSNVNFVVGMVIESRRLVMKNTRVFDFIGRYPRARGRW